MLPEASGSGRLSLYRATDFPLAWQEDRLLLPRPLIDASLVEWGGRWYLLGSDHTRPGAMKNGARGWPAGLDWRHGCCAGFGMAGRHAGERREVYVYALSPASRGLLVAGCCRPPGGVARCVAAGPLGAAPRQPRCQWRARRGLPQCGPPGQARRTAVPFWPGLRRDLWPSGGCRCWGLGTGWALQ